MTDDEKVSPYEDIGGRHNVTGHRPRRTRPEMKRIIYTHRSMMNGEVKTINARIADDLIEKGYAEEVKERETGEEG